jgi:hypothetical protein
MNTGSNELVISCPQGKFKMKVQARIRRTMPAYSILPDSNSHWHGLGVCDIDA